MNLSKTRAGRARRAGQRILAVGAVAATAGLLAACGSSSKPSSSATTTATTTAAENSPNRAFENLRI